MRFAFVEKEARAEATPADELPQNRVVYRDVFALATGDVDAEIVAVISEGHSIQRSPQRFP
jgi:hypothetical protein